MKTIAFTTRLYKPLHQKVSELIQKREISARSLNQAIEQGLSLLIADISKKPQSKKTDGKTRD